MSVRVTDQDGGLEILHGDQLVLGAILNPPPGFAPAQPIRMRMQMQEGDPELVEVIGKVMIREDVALMTGLEFDVDVTRMTRTLTAAPPVLAEGMSEAPTAHRPVAAAAPIMDPNDAPRNVTMPTDTAVDLGPDPDLAFEDELSSDHNDVFADADDDIFSAQVAPPPSASEIDEEPIELTRLEQEIAALDASLENDQTMTSPSPPPAAEHDELASLEAVLEAAVENAFDDVDAGTDDSAEKPRSGFEEDERQTSHERPPRGVKLEVSNEDHVGEPAPYERPPFNIEPLSEEEEEPTLDEPTGIVGTLREMSLCELVQSMEIARKTAQLVINPKGGESGSVFVEGGRVRWAEQGELEGEEAFYILARAFRGTFRMRFHVKPPGENVRQPTPYLVLEALRRMDEGRASGEIEIPELETPAEKERLPSAREVVRAAQRAADRSDRRRAKTQPPARPKSVPPRAADVVDATLVDERRPSRPPPLPPEAFLEEHAPIAARPEAPEKTERKPRKASGSLFSSFFDEASEADNVLDDDDTALARVLSSSDEGRPVGHKRV
jgi:hypothetical protein